MTGQRRSFGQITRLPSKRYRARYLGPDGVRHNGPQTFDAREDAEAWLADERRRLSRGEWVEPSLREAQRRRVTFGDYSDAWLEHRPLKPRTSAHYARLLDAHLLPTFGAMPLASITPSAVRVWHHQFDQGRGPTAERPTLRTHAYGLLRTILQSAVHDGDLPSNPCHIRGAGNAKRAKKIRPASLDELQTIAAEMPAKYRPMLLLAAWCALRFGELTELRRKDLDLTNGVVRVRRAVVRLNGQTSVGTPKSDAGARDVAIPPPLVPLLREHVDERAHGRDALLFPAADGVSHLAPATLYRVFYRARAVAGRPDLRFHDLRHTGAVLAASTGAPLAELMARLGHSTPGAALRYQHAAQERDVAIAEALGDLMDRA